MSETKAKKTTRLTDEQRKAIETVGGPLLLSASAGSGKTSVLTSRVVEKLKSGVPAQEMLIVTFTKAAAAEMRKRIDEALKKERDQATDPKLKRLLSSQILALPQARICTMDAFYGEFVRTYFQKLGVSPDFRNILGAEQTLLTRSTLQSVFDKLYEEGDADFLACIDAFSNETDDTGFFDQMILLLDKLDSDPYPEQTLARMGDMFGQSRLEDTPWYQHLLKYVKESLEQLRPAYEEIALFADAHRVELSDKTADDLMSMLSELDIQLASLNNGKIPACSHMGKVPPLNRTHKKYETYRLIHPKVVAACEKVKELYKSIYIPDPLEFAAQQQVCRQLFCGMQKVVTQYYKDDRAIKRRKNVLSFADTSRLTLSLLVEHYDVQSKQVTLSDFARAYIDGEMGYPLTEVMIDEYQDTNLLQNLIFEALSDNGKNLFCVGDLKQSIYRFRNARPDLFAARLRSFSREDGRFPQVQFLTRNFRSSKGVLGFVNFFFAQFMSDVMGEAAYDQTQWAYAAGTFPDNDYATEILLCDSNDLQWKTIDEDGQVTNDYRQGLICAQRIRELMEQKVTVWDPKKEASRPLEYNDIAILLRRAKGRADAVVRALEDVGIPCYSAKAKTYFDRYEVRFVLSFLRAIDNPYLDIPMAAALRSPIFCLSAQELCDLRENGKGTLYECLSSSQNEKAKRAKEIIDRYRVRAGAEPVYRLIWDIYSEFTLFAAVSAMGMAQARQENLRLIYRHAREYEKSSLRGLYGFLCYMERVEQQQRDAEGTNPAPSGSYVTVSTIHAVKGLEYPYVFVINMDSPFVDERMGKGGMNFSDDLGLGLIVKDRRCRQIYDTFSRQVIKKANHELEASEVIRLLYVAFTRAKERLFLVGTDGIRDKTTTKEPKPGRLPTFLTQSMALIGNGPIHPRIAQGCTSALEMIMLGTLKHPSGLDFAEKIGVELPEGMMADIDLLERSQLSEPTAPRTGIPDLKIRIMDPVAVTDRQTVTEMESTDVEALRDRLDFEYPYRDLCHVPAKVSVSDLKGLRDMDDDAGLMLARQVNYDKPAFLRQGLSAAERGTATHKFMQFMPFDQTPLPQVRDALVRRGTLSREEGAVVDLRQLETFRQSALAKRIAASPYVEREYRFLSQVPAERYDPDLVGHKENIMLQGVIDLFFEENGGITLVDYKTDRSDDEAYYVKKYALQLQLYAEALEKLIGKPVKRRIIYAFSCQKEIDV